MPLRRAELADVAKANKYIPNSTGRSLPRVQAYTSSVHDLYCCSRHLSTFLRKMIDHAREARLTTGY